MTLLFKESRKLLEAAAQAGDLPGYIQLTQTHATLKQYPALKAAASGNNLDLVKLAMQRLRGSRTNENNRRQKIQDAFDYSFSSCRVDFSIQDYLIDEGARVSSKAMTIAMSSRFTNVEYLVMHGADIHPDTLVLALQNHASESFIRYLVEGHYSGDLSNMPELLDEITDENPSSSLVVYLLSKKAAPRRCCLHVMKNAIQQCDVDTVKGLLQGGVNPDFFDGASMKCLLSCDIDDITRYEIFLLLHLYGANLKDVGWLTRQRPCQLITDWIDRATDIVWGCGDGPDKLD